MDSKNRNMVRKAQRSGVTVREAPMSEYAPFLDLYRQTMDKHGAEDYYTFDTSYFDYLSEHLYDHAFLLYAELEEAPISGAIFFRTNGTMHYHLAGSDAAYRNLAAGYLLLYEAALWGAATAWASCIWAAAWPRTTACLALKSSSTKTAAGNSGWAAAFSTRRSIRSFWPSARPRIRPLIRITGL